MQNNNCSIFQFSYSAFVLICKINTIFDSFFLAQKCNTFQSSFTIYLWWRHILIHLSESVLHKIANLHSLSFFNVVWIKFWWYLKLLKAIRIVKEARLILFNLILKGHSYILIVGLKLGNHRHLTNILLPGVRRWNLMLVVPELSRGWHKSLWFLTRNYTICAMPLVWGITHVHVLCRILWDYWFDEIHSCSYGLMLDEPIYGKLPINIGFHRDIFFQALLKQIVRSGRYIYKIFVLVNSYLSRLGTIALLLLI